MGGYVLAIDQGTTSSRAIVFDDRMRIAGVGQQEFAQHYPRSGWVEHDPEEIWQSVLATIRTALQRAGIEAGDIAAIGITNQRETVVVWERETRQADPPGHRLAGPAHVPTTAPSCRGRVSKRPSSGRPD